MVGGRGSFGAFSSSSSSSSFPPFVLPLDLWDVVVVRVLASQISSFVAMIHLHVALVVHMMFAIAFPSLLHQDSPRCCSNVVLNVVVRISDVTVHILVCYISVLSMVAITFSSLMQLDSPCLQRSSFECYRTHFLMLPFIFRFVGQLFFRCLNNFFGCYTRLFDCFHLLSFGAAVVYSLL